MRKYLVSAAAALVGAAFLFGSVACEPLESSAQAAGPAALNWQAQYSALNGSETFLGTLTATAATPVDELNTAVPFAVANGTCYRVQCAAAVFFIPAVMHGAFLDAQSMTIQANQFKDECFTLATGPTAHLAIDPVAGTTSCKVWSLL
jgi:hypothetical protein